MKIKELTISAILLSIGVIFRYIIPGIIGGMKPDLLLVMMFIAIIINPKIPNIVTVSLVSGILAALTTNFPGGQIPNIIDKAFTGIFIGILIYISSKINISSVVKMATIGFVGTLFSGMIFLISAQAIVGLPQGMTISALFFMIVIPTATINSIFTSFLYKVLYSIGIRAIASINK